METGSEILARILDHLDIKINPFGKKIGLDRSQALYDIRDGKIKNISSDLAHKITTAYPEFNLGYILTGDGEMLVNQDEMSVDKNKLSNEAQIASIESNIKLNYVIGMLAELQELVDKKRIATVTAAKVQRLVQSDFEGAVKKLRP